MRAGEKFWELFISEHAVRPLIEPVLDRFYDDGPLPTDLPGLHTEGRWANAWRYERDGAGSLAVLRATVVAARIADVLIYGEPFTHDPGAGEPPAVDRAAFRDAVRARLGGSHDTSRLGYREAIDPDLAPLVVGVTYDGFSDPVDLDAVADALTETVADAIEDGRIDVEASEPWDSCRLCGGYHNVNYDCGHSGY